MPGSETTLSHQKKTPTLKTGESGSDFNTLIALVNQPLIIFREDGTRLFSNDLAHGYARSLTKDVLAGIFSSIDIKPGQYTKKALTNQDGQSFELEISLSKIQWQDQPALLLLINDMQSNIVINDSKQIFNNIVQSVHEGIIVMDDMGEIMFLNQAAEHLIGHPADEIIGENFATVLKNTGDGVFFTFLQNYFSSESDANEAAIDTRIASDNGQSIPICLTVRPAQLTNRKIYTLFIQDLQIQDITNENASLKQHLANSNAEINRLGSSLKESQDELFKVNTNLKANIKKQKDLNNLCDQLSKAKIDLEKKNTETRTMIENLNLELKKMKAELIELSENFEEKTLQLSEITRLKDQLADEKLHLVHEIAVLREILAKTLSEKEFITEEASKTLKQRDTLLAELATIKTVLKEKQNEIGKITTERDRAQKKVHDLEKMREKFHETITNQQSEISRIKKEVASIERERHKFEAELSKSQKINVANQTTITEIKTKLANANSDLSKALAHQDHLVLEYNTLKKSYKESENVITSLNGKITILNSQVKELTSSYEIIKNELNENTAELTREHQELLSTKKDLNAANQKLISLTRDNEQQKTRLAEVEDELKQSQIQNSQLLRKYEFIANTAEEFMTLINRDFIYEAVNDSYCRAIGKPREEIIGKTISEIWGKATFQKNIRGQLERCLAGQVVQFESTFEFQEGERDYYRVAYYPYRNDKNIVTHAVVVTTDITKMKQAERAMQIQYGFAAALSSTSNLEEALRDTLQAIQKIEEIETAGIELLITTSGEKQFFGTHNGISEAFTSKLITHLKKTNVYQEITSGKSVYLSTDDLNRIPNLPDQIIKAMAITPVLYEGNLIAIIFSGSKREFMIPDNSRQILEAIAIQAGSAIARVKAEESHRESQRNYQALFDTLDDFLFILKPSGHFLYSNPILRRRLGYSASELSKRTFMDIHPKELQDDANAVIKLLENEPSAYCPLAFSTKIGTTIPVETRFSHGTWYNQKVLFGISRDITDRIKAGQALRESEDRFRALFNHSEDAIILTDDDGLIISANKATSLMFGYLISELTTMHISDIMSDQLPINGINQATGHRIKKTPFESIGKQRNGELLPVEVSITPLTIGEQKISFFTIRNISERKKSQEAFFRYNQILENVSNIAELFLKSASWEQNIPEILSRLAEAANADKANIYRNHYETDGKLNWSKVYQWTKEDISKEVIATREDFIEVEQHGLERWVSQLQNDQICSGHVQFLPENEVNFFEKHHIASMIAIPIFIEKDWWGFLDFETTTEHSWTPLEADAFRIASSIIGAAFQRKSAEMELVNYRNRLEEMVRERTNELARVNQELEQEIIERKRTQYTLQQSEANLKAIFDNTEQSFILLDVNKTILTFNRIAFDHTMQISGKKLENNLDIETFFLNEEFPEFSNYIDSALEGNSNTVEKFHCITPEHKKWFEFCFMPVNGADSQVIGVSLSILDTTERKQMEIALSEEHSLLAQRVAERTGELSAVNAELARAVRAKDEFLANMSHELRTPLNAILSISETIAEEIHGPLNPRQMQSLQDVIESGKRLLELINNILDLSKIEAGRVTPQFTNVRVSSVCQSSISSVKAQAEKSKIQLELSIEDEINEILTDERRLKQILIQLLVNAIKFNTENGRVGLDVHLKRECQSLCFSVWDTGIGIDPENFSKLFKPFSQLDSRLSREYGGTGLGLVLVNRMTELLGGGITFESAPGQGSKFCVMLPLDTEEAQETLTFYEGTEIVAHTMLNPSTQKNKPSILVADDNENTLVKIMDVLRETNHRIIIARNGNETLERARETLPDTIIMDIQMPGMDGLEATRRIRSDINLASIPIILTTSLDMPGEKEKAMTAGANEYLVKPVSRNLILNALNKLRLDNTTRGLK